MRLSDYGGHARDRGRPTTIRVEADKVRSYRCAACGHVTFYTHRQVGRMKHFPRCNKCGGSTEETEASFHRRTGFHKAEVGKAIGRVLVRDGAGRLTEDQDFKMAADTQCRFCFKPFRNSAALKLHYEEVHDFKEEF